MGSEGAGDASGSLSGGVGVHKQGLHRILLLEIHPRRAQSVVVELKERAVIFVAQNLDAALERLHRQEADAVLCDLDLPGFSPKELILRLRQPYDGHEAPVLAVSSHSEWAVPALEAGAADFIAEPWKPGELAARMERAIQHGQVQKELRKLAQTDPLTGLFNYGAFETRLKEELSRAQRYRHPMSLAILDLDYLKHINDRFGHAMGNRALVAVAQHLKANLRQTDFAARFGGDEFVAVLPYQEESLALVFAERVRSGLGTLEVALAGGRSIRVPLSLSVGVADYLPGKLPNTPEALLHAADLALYQAKESGRNRAVAHRDMEAHAPFPSQ